jgi:hypothetical protein
MSTVKTRRRHFLILGALVVVVSSCTAFLLVDTRTIGRTDLRRAASFRFNFVETYSTGSVLGVKIGQTKLAAIQSAEQAGFQLQPSAWGDNRAGGANLYERSELLEKAMKMDTIHMGGRTDTKQAIELRFNENRLIAIKLLYINFENI